MEADVGQMPGRDLIVPGKYRKGLTGSVVLHLLLLVALVIVPALRRPKKFLDQDSVLMAELMELEPPAPEEPPKPDPVPPPPAPKPKPKREDPPPPPKPVPPPEPMPPPKPKTQKEREQKLEELRMRRAGRELAKVEPERSYQPPAPPKPSPQKTQTATPSNPVRAKGKPFPYAYYLILVKNALWEIWRPPRVAAPEGISAVVSFEILKNGSVPTASVKLTRSSGLGSYDQSCLHAVRSVQLPPLPPNFTSPSLELNCIFNAEER